ncbi:MAG: hypothetical protein OH338_02920 [Candidatus Parvarchaeota archaeon]|nr:hypothetical protein [Candidatus Parvarchaeum tengchongense]
MSFKAFSRDFKNNKISLIKSRRSQSALEYMMTYGWAILIIVIVAVILYSMGIFNPSSSVTFTSSGFTPFTVSSSLCNNLGYKIAIIAGPIPDNANSLTISKVFLTSATGANTTTAAYTLTNPVTLKSGQTATILIPNVACSSAGIHYSLSASIQYSYSTTAGNVVENTTGTVAGTSIAGKPSVLTSYEPLTITNTQNTATPSPFQQMVNFTSSDPGWTSISTSNFGQNVEFFYYNGTVIPSWLESYSSSNAIWWLKIAAIPAGSSETVYVGFAPITTNLFNNVNDGEAPQLSSTYAEYDTGFRVFNYYVNFNSTTLPQNWHYSLSSGSTCTIDNGVTCTAPLFSSNYGCAFIEYYYNLSNLGTKEAFDWGSGPFTQDVKALYIQEGGGPYCTPGPGYFNLLGVSGSTTLYGASGTYAIPDNIGYPSFSGFLNSTDGFVFQFNYNTFAITSGPVASSYFGKNWFAVGDVNDSSTPPFYWFDIRNLPPNDIMPSVSFGSIA